MTSEQFDAALVTLCRKYKVPCFVGIYNYHGDLCIRAVGDEASEGAMAAKMAEIAHEAIVERQDEVRCAGGYEHGDTTDEL